MLLLIPKFARSKSNHCLQVRRPNPTNYKGDDKLSPLYSVGTWDTDEQAYTPQVGVPAFNLTLAELRRSMRLLRQGGYQVHRKRAADGTHDNNDPQVLIERTDGKSEAEILKQWER